LGGKTVKKFEICFNDFKLNDINGDFYLSREGVSANIPGDIVGLVRWALTKQNFEREDLLANFRALGPERIDYAIENLKKMNVLREF